MVEGVQTAPSHGVSGIGLVLLPLVTIAIITIGLLNGGTYPIAPVLFLTLNLVFFGLASLLIATLIGRSFLLRGTPDLLLVGCGALLWGLAGVASGIIGPEKANTLVTIHNTGAAIAALCHLEGAILSNPGRPSMRRRVAWMATAYSASIVVTVLISLWTIRGHLPPFFTQYVGGTVLRQTILGSAVLMFVLAAVILRVKNRHSLSPFVHWYTLALLFIAAGLFAVLLEPTLTSLMSWIGRSVQYLGGIFMVVAAIAAIPSSRWTVSLDTSLVEARQQYEDLFNLAADGILVHEPISQTSRGKITQGNRAICRLLGYTQQEICALTVLDLVESGHQPAARRDAEEAEPTSRHEKSLIAKDGRHIRAEFTTQVFRHGNRPMAMSIIRDITERQRSEEALRESEERLRLTLLAAEIGTFEYRPATGEVQLDARAKAIWGLPADVQMSYREALWRVHPADRRQFAERFEAALDPQSDGYLESEYRILFPDGSVHWHSTKGRVDFEGRGPGRHASRMIGIYLDSTERKQWETALSEAMQRLDAHIDNSPLAVIEFDPELRVTRWSDEARRLFGWTAEEVLGHTASEMDWTHEDDKERVQRTWRDMIDGKRSRYLSVQRNYRRDGSVVECEWYNSAIFDREGRLFSVLSQVLDVTDRKRTEERLRQAQKMESIALLAGGVAHDFNNLLVGVIGNASLAMELLPPEHPAGALLDGVVKAGEQAAHLTRQMLAYSGQGRYVLQPVDLSEVVREVTELVRSTAPKKVAIQLDLEPDLPEIEGDRSQIHQVLMNLVINSTEAMGNAPGLIVVQTGMRNVGAEEIHQFQGTDLAPGSYVTLEVRDNGAGMDEETAAKIFDPFFTTKFQGRGLGLAAVAGIVRAHKGALRVQTAPSRGTSFLLLFPAMKVRPARASRLRPPLPVTDFSGCGTVLVVDDEERVQTTARLALERRGCAVQTTGSGEEAIEILRADEGRIVIVILDLNMPGMSGVEALPRMLEIHPNLRVLVTSGYAEADVLRRFEGMPVAGFLQKPYTARQIAEKVRAIMKSGVERES
jgi:two-component system, cell cycle sensor histidine kinase and response regulator CckA